MPGVGVITELVLWIMYVPPPSVEDMRYGVGGNWREGGCGKGSLAFLCKNPGGIDK